MKSDDHIVIFGVSGFIGSRISQEFPGSQGISLREPGWEERVKRSQPHVLINLVGKAHDHKNTSTIDDYHYSNVKTLQLIFDVFKDSSARLLIHVSSIAAVEEIEASVPLVETAPCQPQTWYGQSKLDGEEWLFNQKLPFDKKIIVLRPPMVHGAGDPGNLGLLCKLISRGIPYPLGAFENRRSFISVQNFSFYLHEIVANHNKLNSGIYHVSDDEPVSTNEIIQIIERVSGTNIIRLRLPRSLVRNIAKIGDYIPIPLNTKRLKKMTRDLIVSNCKIKKELSIDSLPLSAKKGLEETIRSLLEAGRGK